MDASLLMEIVTGLIGLLVMILAWNFREYKSDHEKLEVEHRTLRDKHAEHKLDVSENYARKSDLNEARREWTEGLRRVYEKIEQVNDNFDKKISELPEKMLRMIEHGK